MMNHQNNQFERTETTCGSLLCELQEIWDEVGEPDIERDKMILEIEKKCLEVYKRTVEEAKMSRAQLQQAIALYEAEIADVCSSMGEQPVHCDWKAGENLKERLETIAPQLENVRKMKMERNNQFVDVLYQLQKISNEIYTEDNMYHMIVDETDLSEKRLEELRRQLADLQNEKRNRLKQVMDHLCNLSSLCVVLGEDFKDTVSKIHPTLDNSEATKDVSDNTIEKLVLTIQSLHDVKIQRMQKLKVLATSLLELWCLMDTPMEEQRMFQNVTSIIAASEPEVTEPNMLSLNNIKFVEGEVSRLMQFKSIKMKEIVLKKWLELEEICRKMHMITDALREYSIDAIESASVDPVYLLEQTELQIAIAKEETFSRKEILEKVEKWFAAREEECWLEEYNRDDNRYNAGRGAHLTLKRAEKARAAVTKIPAILETLTSKVTAWEKERGTEFYYDGVRLLSMLEDYSSLRQEKEQEKQRQRDQKKLHGQFIAERETFYGSKPSPSKSAMKAPRPSIGIASNRKLSLGGAMLQNLKPGKTASGVHANNKTDCLNRNGQQQPGGLVAHSGRRNSEIGGHVVKKNSSVAAKGCQVKSPLNRKPLSPFSSNKANIANFLEDHKRTQEGTLQETNPGIIKMTPLVTPSKQNAEENRRVKTMLPPTTPSAVAAAPMVISMTPANHTPCVSYGGGKTIEKTEEKVEYSFEEVRAGFICPQMH